jgi:hypothetical protein
MVPACMSNLNPKRLHESASDIARLRSSVWLCSRPGQPNEKSISHRLRSDFGQSGIRNSTGSIRSAGRVGCPGSMVVCEPVAPLHLWRNRCPILPGDRRERNLRRMGPLIPTAAGATQPNEAPVFQRHVAPIMKYRLHEIVKGQRAERRFRDAHCR